MHDKIVESFGRFCNPYFLYGKIVIMNTQIHFDKKKIANISQKHKLVFAILFGSKARGERENKESDLDIAVLSSQESDYDLFKKLFSDFSNIFRGYNVDVRFLNDTDLLFRFQVVKDGVLLYGDENKYFSYRLLTIRRYIDDGRKYFPIFDRMLRERQDILNNTV